MQNDNNHKNLAAAILENGGYSSDTSLTIPTTSAATFPDVPFFATIMPTTDLANSNNSEIVEVTATSESGSDTTFTISRGQRGTTAINWDAGKAVLVHAIYTEDVVYIDTTLSAPTNIAYVSEDNIQNGAVTTSKIANGAVTSQNIDWATIGWEVYTGATPSSGVSQVVEDHCMINRKLKLFSVHFDVRFANGAPNTLFSGLPEPFNASKYLPAWYVGGTKDRECATCWLRASGGTLACGTTTQAEATGIQVTGMYPIAPSNS